KYTFSLICPAWNDEQTLAAVAEKADALFSRTAADYEIVIVNASGSDNTGAVADVLAAKYPKIRAVHHLVHRGYGAALKTGIKEAGNFDFICFAEGGGQCDMADFEKMFPLLEQCDAVTGYRVGSRGGGAGRLMPSIYNFVLRMLFPVPYKDLGCPLKIVKREALREIKVSSNGPFMVAELILRLHRQGYKIEEVPVKTRPQPHDQSSPTNFSSAIRTICDMAKLRYKFQFRGRNT
ncbi:MAG: glycosyltransferase family 2 protein, partial [Nitrospinales bacterium]